MAAHFTMPALGDDAEEDWSKLTAGGADGDGKLWFLDCHRDWCGPCEILHPTLQRLCLDTPECDSRLAFRSVDLSNSSKVKGLLPPEEAEELDHLGCKPLFLLVRDGTMRAKISGADAPAILRQIAAHIPKIADDNEES
jgi:thioredoxin 1